MVLLLQCRIQKNLDAQVSRTGVLSVAGSTGNDIK